MTAQANTLRGDARIIGLIGLAHGTSHLFQLLLPPLFPQLKQEFGVTYAELGLLVTVLYAVSGVSQALAGFVVDRLGARRVLLLGLGLLATAAALGSIAHSYLILAVCAGLIGLGNSVFHPADFSILNTRVSARRLGHAFSVHGMSGNLGYATAPILFLSIASAYSWRGALLAASVIALVMFGLVWSQRDVLDEELRARVIKERGAFKPTHPAAIPSTTMTLLLNGTVISCFLFFVFSAFAGIGAQNFSPSMLTAIYGVSSMLAATMLTGFLASGAGGMIVGGFLANGTARHDVVAATGSAGAAIVFMLLASGIAPPPVLFLLMCIGGFVIGMTNPSRDMLARLAAPHGATGRVFGIVYSGVDLGAAISPTALGWLLDHRHPQGAFLILAIALCVNVVLALSARQYSSAALAKAVS
jgi:MFS transporter, FSR family, fosmidomycin resistance protein